MRNNQKKTLSELISESTEGLLFCTAEGYEVQMWYMACSKLHVSIAAQLFQRLKQLIPWK